MHPNAKITFKKKSRTKQAKSYFVAELELLDRQQLKKLVSQSQVVLFGSCLPPAARPPARPPPSRGKGQGARGKGQAARGKRQGASGKGQAAAAVGVVGRGRASRMASFSAGTVSSATPRMNGWSRGSTSVYVCMWT